MSNYARTLNWLSSLIWSLQTKRLTSIKRLISLRTYATTSRSSKRSILILSLSERGSRKSRGWLMKLRRLTNDCAMTLRPISLSPCMVTPFLTMRKELSTYSISLNRPDLTQTSSSGQRTSLINSLETCGKLLINLSVILNYKEQAMISSKINSLTSSRGEKLRSRTRRLCA